MTKLHSILAKQEDEKYAMNEGTNVHAKLRRVFVDGDKVSGDSDYVQCIQARDDLLPLFGAGSRTEVPIAGTIDGRFVSRRIDRLVIDDAAQTILVLDYKTDVSREKFRDAYYAQIREYGALLRAIYPTYQIKGFILWVHDFSLENVSMN